jgi:hypothetical protein
LLLNYLDTGANIVYVKTGPIKAKVYSVGVYLDKGSLLLQCKDLKSLNVKELLACKEFENTVVEGDTDKRIVLRMARKVC